MDFVWSSGQREAELFVIQMGHTQKVTQAIQWSEKMRKTDRQDQVIWHLVNFLSWAPQLTCIWMSGASGLGKLTKFSW